MEKGVITIQKTTQVCPVCGGTNPIHDKFCGHCGHAFGNSVASSTGQIFSTIVGIFTGIIVYIIFKKWVIINNLAAALQQIIHCIEIGRIKWQIVMDLPKYVQNVTG